METSSMSPVSPEKRWKRNILLAAVLSTALGTVYMSFEWAVGALIHSRNVVLVPDLTGKSVPDALNLLGQSHLGLIKDGDQFDKRFPAGTIILQSPQSGTLAREGRLIKITLSQGGETLFVPDLVGQPLRNAQTALQNTGLSMGEVDHRPSLRFEKDQVMSTDPPSGAVIAKNGLVNVALSEGPPGSDILLVPDFTGKSIVEAKTWAAQHQLNVTVQNETDITKPSGNILNQAPAGDSPVHSGEALTIVVNQSADTTAGPHVHFDVPSGGGDRDVRILVMDSTGEHEVFRKSQPPGSVVDLPVQVNGHTRARILVNGILAKEEELQ